MASPAQEELKVMRVSVGLVETKGIRVTREQMVKRVTWDQRARKGKVVLLVR